MAFKYVSSIEEVSIGLNYHYCGSVILKENLEEGLVHLKCGDNAYEVGTAWIDEDNCYESEIFKYKEKPKYILGRAISFELETNYGRNSFYFVVCDKDSHTPILVYVSEPIGLTEQGYYKCSKRFCYLPEKNTLNDIYEGLIGSITMFDYNIAYNKCRLLKLPTPKKIHKAKIIKLVNKVEKSKYIPETYDISHEDIHIEGIIPRQINKNYLVDHLSTISKKLGDSAICFGEYETIYKDKIDKIIKYFKAA